MDFVRYIKHVLIMLNLTVLSTIWVQKKNIAHAIAQAVYDFDSSLILVGLSNTLLITEAESLGLRTASEVFADRRYEDNGQLVSRKRQMQ